MRAKLIAISAAVLIIVSAILIFIPVQAQDANTWPKRPAGRQFRVWLKPVEKEFPDAPGGTLTNTYLEILWQTGRKLPNCHDGGIWNIFAYDPETGSPAMGGATGGTLGPDAGITSDTPCSSLDFNNSVLIKHMRGKEVLFTGSHVVQLLQPKIRFPSGSRAAVIRWAQSKPLKVLGDSLSSVQCFGPAPCPTEIPQL